MVNFYKYLPVSKDDEGWGLTILNAGCTHIEALDEYPYKNHPAHHNFDWKNWRKLEEYQIIYITRGQGVFESENHPRSVIKAGTVIFLFPNERHRYKPDSHSGWDEYWVGVKGEIMDGLLASQYIRVDKPCHDIGFNGDVLNLYSLIIDQTKQEKTGYQPLVAGVVYHLLGLCHSIIKQQVINSKADEIIIEKARLLFRSNINNSYSCKQAAEELCVGYSWFRKRFKSYTGMSPGQYYLQLKIEKAKELLNYTDIPIKQVSIELGFDNCFYFSNIFKDKTGSNPTDYRKRTHESGR